METCMNALIGDNYTSNSQRIRVITESWAADNISCPNCGEGISTFENNRPVADFFCYACREEFELKSKARAFGKKICDGAYQSMLERLGADNNPNLFLLCYDHYNLAVKDFLVIPKHFFVSDIIERRKPLSATARRAGWVGCNISLVDIPRDGKIYYIRNGEELTKTDITDKWAKTLFLRDTKGNEKGWLLDIMLCVDSVGRDEFGLTDIYAFESELAKKHPDNKHVRAKMRQQLQMLRDRGYIEFIGKGKYRVI